MMEFEEILQWSPIFFRTKEIYYVNLLKKNEIGKKKISSINTRLWVYSKLSIIIIIINSRITD